MVKFNTGGISGYIKFAEVGQDVRIEATLQGLGGKYRKEGLICLIPKSQQ